MRIPTARGTAPLWLRLARELPYPADRVRSVTLLCEGGRLSLEVTAEVPVAEYDPGCGPDPQRVIAARRCMISVVGPPTIDTYGTDSAIAPARPLTAGAFPRGVRGEHPPPRTR